MHCECVVWCCLYEIVSFTGTLCYPYSRTSKRTSMSRLRLREISVVYLTHREMCICDKKIMNFLYSRYYCWMHSSSYPYFSFLVWVGCAGCMQIFAVCWWTVTKQYRMFLCMFADDSCSFTLCSKAEAMFRLYVSPVGKHRACVCSAGVQLNTV